MELKNVGLILFYSYVHLFVDARWSGNLKPNFIRDYETTLKTADRYIEHSDLSRHFRLLEEDGEYLLIGARNSVYNFSLKSFKPSYKLDWISAEHTKETCIMKGKSEEVCQNFIRVLLKKSPSEFLICGTNAYSPKCRVYETSLSGELRLQEGSEAQGVGFCPYDPDHNSTSIYADGEFYGATVSDFNAEDALVYSKGIRTLANDRKVFNNPSFISAMDYENFVYFTFRETAVDFASCGDKVLSRIGRVCKNDEGGSRHILRNSFTSFTKATINCSLPGADPYYFNEVQAMTRLVKNQFGTSTQKIVYGIFSTPDNSFGGWAICGFDFQNIEKVFNGKFKEQKTVNHVWRQTPDNLVPVPRPGQCSNDSRSLPETTLKFAETHPIMFESVSATHGQPIFTQAGALSSALVQIEVEPQVQAVDGKRYDILYVGTNDGKVLKIVSFFSTKPLVGNIGSVIVEELQVIRSQQTITNLRIASSRLVVVSDDEIYSLPLARCHLASTCYECVAMQDPHCAWNMEAQKCQNYQTEEHLTWNTGAEIWLQNVEQGRHVKCPFGASVNDEDNMIESSLNEGIAEINSRMGRRLQLEESSEHVPKLLAAEIQVGNLYREETLAVAVVITLILSLTVGFFIGFQLRAYKMSSDKDSNISVESNLSDYPCNYPSIMNMDHHASGLPLTKFRNDELPISPYSTGNMDGMYLSSKSTNKNQTAINNNATPRPNIKNINNTLDSKNIISNKSKQVYL